jgi:hypothetical protein
VNRFLYPKVVKAGGILIQNAKGVAVVNSCKPFATLEMDSSGFPARVKTLGSFDDMWFATMQNRLPKKAVVTDR